MRSLLNISLRRLALGGAASASAMITIVACGSDDTRARFDGSDSGGANLPEASAPVEAGPPVDAGSTKPPFDPKDEEVTCAGTPCAVQLVAGESHFCARMSDGTVRCWGKNGSGELGAPDPTQGEDGVDAGAFVVSRVGDLAGATQISAGGGTTCALVGNGGVSCWGANDRGQLGLDAKGTSDGDPHPTPAPVALQGAANRIDVGQQSACATLASGDAWCWGDNTQLQLARTTETEVGGPAKAELGSLKVARTASGTNSAFAVTTAGDVFSWGAIAGPEGSIAARTASISPDALPLSIELGPVTSFALTATTIKQDSGFPRPPPRGYAHACAIVKGELFCWGASLMGSLGTGLPEPAAKPIPASVASEKGWPQQVAAGGDITCVRLTDGTVQCAGDNMRGVLGKEPTTDPFSMFFREVPSFTGHAVQIATASGTACALVQGGSVVCWGANDNGELGQGTTDADPHIHPVSIRF
jgi:Regulator of chromosome condensation (RCC1) repeat